MSASSIPSTPDVLIIGGGPAGSTIGTHLASAGRRVVLLEKSQHPRFHIGESLLPMNMPILKRLGVLDKVKTLGVKKLGADFTYGENEKDYLTYRFNRALTPKLDNRSDETFGYAYEIKREEFDCMLFDNGVEAGVTAFQNHTVNDVRLDAKNGHRVSSTDAEGTQHEWRPKFVIDASGRDALLASRNKWKRKNPRHASAAIFGHFKGVTRRPGEDAGNISLYWFPHGWMWMIPLQNDIVSVGAVCWPEYLKQRKGDADAFFKQTLALCPAANVRMRDAETAAPVRVTGNYSYKAKRMTGDGYLMLGDAFGFIDPVFSSGVYLAMNSAERAVPLVEHWLNENKIHYRVSALKYEHTIRKGLRGFSWFIYRFTSPAMRTLFHGPKNIWQVEQAVISMLAGDVFDNPAVRRRLYLFRLIYSVSWLVSWKKSFVARRLRSKNANQEFSET